MKSAVYSKRGGIPSAKTFDELFNFGLDQFLGSDSMSSVLPAVNVLETDEDFKIELVAAGFAKEDFQVKAEKNLLTISANVEVADAEKQVKYTRREFKKQSFKRSFELPHSVNTEGISASYVNGILRLTLPKKEEAIPVNKVIEIK